MINIKILIKRIMEEFYEKYPAYKTDFKAQETEGIITLTLLGEERQYDLLELPVKEDDKTKEEMLWADITILMANMVEAVQRDIIRGGLDELKEMIQKT